MNTYDAAKKQFDKCQTAEALNRQRARDDIAFALDLDQWPAGAASARKQAGKPTLSSPLPAKYLRDIVNQARALRPSVRVKPVDNKADKLVSRVMEGLIRNIEYQSGADMAYDTAIEHAVQGGVGFVRVSTDYANAFSFDLELRIERIADQFMVYGDPASLGLDSSDWNDCFILALTTEEALKREYPKRATFSSWSADDVQVDDGILIAEWFHREYVTMTIHLLSDGQVVDAGKFTPDIAAFYAAQGVTVKQSRVTAVPTVKRYMLDGEGELSAETWAGSYIPVVPVYGIDYVSNGKRVLKGAVSDAKDPQIMDNYWASTATELVANAPKVPWIAEENALVDSKQWAKSGKADVPYLYYKKGAQPPQRPGSDPAPAAVLMAQAASGSVVRSVMGADQLPKMINGSPTASDNKRSVLSTDTNYHFADNLTRAVRHVGRILIDMIPRVYSNRSVVRIMGEKGDDNNVDMTQLPLDIGSYDIDVKAGDSYATRREETRYALTELLRTYPQATPLVGPLLLDNLDIPGIETVKAQLIAQTQPQADTGPTFEQQILQQQVENDARKLELEFERLKLQADKQRFDQEVAIKKLEFDEFSVKTEAALSAENLAIKQQSQNLKEVEAGVDIAATYVKL